MLFVRDITLKNPDDYQQILDVAPIFDEELGHDPRLATTNNVSVISGDWKPDFWLNRYFPNENELRNSYYSGRYRLAAVIISKS